MRMNEAKKQKPSMIATSSRRTKELAGEVSGQFKSGLDAARNRFSYYTPEFWFVAAGILVTVSWIFSYFRTYVPPLGTSFGIPDVFTVFSAICLYIMYGFLIYFTALLSLYFDERQKLNPDAIYSSNFVFTRLFTSVARAILLLIALMLITDPTPGIPFLM